jgi:TPR repeat protein
MIEWNSNYEVTMEQGWLDALNTGDHIDLDSMDPLAKVHLAKRLLTENCVPNADKLAARLYIAAAEMGLASAQYNLADLYLRGLGVPKNPAQAVVWLEEAASQGDRDALYSLGMIYEFGNEGVAADIRKAMDYFLRAATQGLARAQYEYACACMVGRGVIKDINLAKYWFAKAAEQGVGRARRQLEILGA